MVGIPAMPVWGYGAVVGEVKFCASKSSWFSALVEVFIE